MEGMEGGEKSIDRQDDMDKKLIYEIKARNVSNLKACRFLNGCDWALKIIGTFLSEVQLLNGNTAGNTSPP